MIALGLTVELIGAGLVLVGLLLGEQRAAASLWVAVAVALLGLAITSAGVARARPPRRAPVAVSQAPRPPVGDRTH